MKNILPWKNIHAVLKENIIDKLQHDYDFIFLDSGPHLDAFLKTALGAADLMLTPLPPATVDFHSSLKFVASLPAPHRFHRNGWAHLQSHR